MEKALYYLCIFFIYSIIGWIVESIYVSTKDKKIINRGFLIGPYCPIYGFGCICIITYLTQYKNNIITVFILSATICSILEYITSYLMEKLFKTRWWDYSNEKFNLNGRICGKNTCLFGIGSIIIIYLVQPIIDKLLIQINKNILIAITIFILIIFIIDIIISLKIVNKFKKTINNVYLKKDATQEISRLVKETLFKDHSVFQKRLFQAFPNIDLKKITKFIKNDQD